LPEFFWKWRKEIAFSLLILISLGLLVAQRQPDIFTTGIRQGVALVLLPLQKLSTAAIHRARHTVSLLTSLGTLRSENTALKNQVERLRLEILRLKEGAAENAALRQQLGYKQKTRWKFIPAEVIARDPASWLERVRVNRGYSDGVRAGAGVITPLGVAGRISEVNFYSATVMLLPDPQSSVAAEDERSRVPGTVKGNGSRSLALLHVTGEDDVRAGDPVVTSSISTIFPSGIPVGEVAGVAPRENDLMLEIHLKPRVEFNTLDRVLILEPEE